MNRKILDSTLNYWEVHKQLKTIEPFKSLIKDKGEEESSSIMWFVAYTWDIDSELFEMPFEDRASLVGLNIMQDSNYYVKNKKMCDELCSAYIDVFDTTLHRKYRVNKKKLEERTQFFNDLDYREDNWDMIDKMILSEEKIFKAMNKLKEEVFLSDTQGEVRGKKEPSLSDADMI